MPKVSALPEDTNPTLDDFTYNLDSSSTVAEKSKWSNVLKMFMGSIYPVGTIYTSTNSTNPGTSLGFGTWVSFGAGRTLIGNGTSDQAFAAGATGGESNHVTSWNEMPVHNHGVNDPGHSHSGGANYFLDAGGGGNLGLNTPGNRFAQGLSPLYINGSGTGISTQNAGSGAAHNNLPPYIVVYFWQRTA